MFSSDTVSVAQDPVVGSMEGALEAAPVLLADLSRSDVTALLSLLYAHSRETLHCPVRLASEYVEALKRQEVSAASEDCVGRDALSLLLEGNRRTVSDEFPAISEQFLEFIVAKSSELICALVARNGEDVTMEALRLLHRKLGD